MSDNRGVLIIGEGAVLKGEVKSGRRVEVYGYVEGNVAADEVIVQEGGKLFGQLKSDRAEVHGTLQGDVRVQQLITIRKTGSASGSIKYGRLAMEEGAELSANVRNIPPSIGGDLDLTVGKDKAVRITLADLNALDPDDKPEDLTFEVSNAVNGFVSFAAAPKEAITAFTQADLEDGRVFFAHDGSDGATAKFDVQVTDKSGATSGPLKSVNVAILN